jgi:hypothetical protein
MKYILMMAAKRAEFDRYAAWSKEDLQANVSFMRAFSKELKDSGVFVSTEGLGWPSEAKLVTAASDGEPITDGVFPESKEFLAGYTGLSMSRAPARLTRLQREPHKLPAQAENHLTCPSKCGPF